MNCEESRKLVYLFHEIDDNDRRRLATHCSTCHACSALLVEMQAQREQVQNVFADVTLEYPAVLTASVMREIEANQKKKAIFRIAFFTGRIRHAFAALSLLMVVFFAYESTMYSNRPTSSATVAAVARDETVVLNSTAIMKRVATSVDEAPAIRCWRDCRSDLFPSECTTCIEKLSKRSL